MLELGLEQRFDSMDYMQNMRIKKSELDFGSILSV